MILGMWRAALVPLFAMVLVSAVSRAQPSGEGQERSTRLAPLVQAVHVQGGQEFAATAEAAAKSALQTCLDRLCGLDPALRAAAETVVHAYQEHGYYKVVVGDPSTQWVASDKIDVTFTVTLGAIYKLQDITFTHVTAFPPAQLRAVFPLHPGDIFNARAFANGLDSMRRLYATKGHINFAPIPVPEFNDESKTVAWTIDVDEGPAFIIGALVLDGPEPAPGLGKRLITDWQPLIGKVYNPELLKRFLQDHAKFLGVRNPDPNAMFDTLLDNKDHVVTLRLHFPE